MRESGANEVRFDEGRRPCAEIIPFSQGAGARYRISRGGVGKGAKTEPLSRFRHDLLLGSTGGEKKAPARLQREREI